MAVLPPPFPSICSLSELIFEPAGLDFSVRLVPDLKDFDHGQAPPFDQEGQPRLTSGQLQGPPPQACEGPDLILRGS
jgi:hypothetical protein